MISSASRFFNLIYNLSLKLRQIKFKIMETKFRTRFYALGIPGALVFILVISIISSYNSLVRLEESINQSWADVESSYQRRNDLIPNLVNVVKGYAKHEKTTLTAVIEARAKATSVSINPENINAASLQQFQQAQGELSSALSKLMVVVERYPDLKANQNFLNLQEQLEGTENRINFVRERFNEETRTYNTKRRRFLTSLWIKWFYSGFESRPYFQSQGGANVAPEIDF